MVFLLKSNRNTLNRTYTIEDAPETIHDKPFYNLKLDEEQKEFVKAIYDKESLIDSFSNITSIFFEPIIGTIQS